MKLIEKAVICEKVKYLKRNGGEKSQEAGSESVNNPQAETGIGEKSKAKLSKVTTRQKY